jgi:RNA polymerase sigma-70 factor (ECF subfamily)
VFRSVQSGGDEDRYRNFEISTRFRVTKAAVQRQGAAFARAAGNDEVALLERLRAGDEDAFVDLVGRHHQVMVRLARSYVPSQAVAEDVVQETWLAMLRGLPAFEGRSSVKTWLYAILLNRARTAGLKERRQIPIEFPEWAVDQGRFDREGSWTSPPTHWMDETEDRVRAERLTKSLHVAIDQLPSPQRDVLTLRDMEGMTAADTCEILGLRQGHQRVLLHRARCRLRSVLEAEFGEDGA